MIEVSTESALQPLIQLYTIYIGLIMSSDLTGIDTNWQVLLDAMMNKNWIQIFSITQIHIIIQTFSNIRERRETAGIRKGRQGAEGNGATREGIFN